MPRNLKFTKNRKSHVNQKHYSLQPYYTDYQGLVKICVTLYLNFLITLQYFPYGKTLRYFESAAFEEKFLTTQHERDRETGFDYRGARYYDSDLGRFLSLDPLAAQYPAWSDYVYVLGNPVKFVDPDGKEPEDIIIRGKNNSSVVLRTSFVDLTFNVNHDFRGNHVMNPSRNPESGSANSVGEFFRSIDNALKGNGDRMRLIKNGNTHTSSDAMEYNNSGIEGKSEHTINVDWFTATKAHQKTIPTWTNSGEYAQNIGEIINNFVSIYSEIMDMNEGEETTEQEKQNSPWLPSQYIDTSEWKGDKSGGYIRHKITKDTSDKTLGHPERYLEQLNLELIKVSE